jgi:type VI protein secretion system component Hcp
MSSQQAYAAVDMFLKIDGIDGESTDKEHRNQIEIFSWSWSASNTGTVGTGGTGTGKTTGVDLELMKLLDTSSPIITEKLFTGAHIRDAELSLRKPGSSFDFAKYKMTDILITSIRQGGSSGDVPVDQFTLNFAKLEVTHTVTNPDGKPGATAKTCWDFKANKACLSSPLPPTDSDGDGIADVVDTEPLAPSNDFADDDPEPTTTGTINRGDQSISVTDEADPEGVRIVAALGGGASPATVSVCSNTAVISLDAGDEVILTCNSVDVVAVTGSIDVTFTAIDGTTGTTTLAAGDSVTFEPQTFTVTNNGDTEVIITVNGNPILIPAGGSVNIDTKPPTIIAPSDITIEATGQFTTVSLGTATATDNEDPSPAITNNAPASFPVGITTVTWTATDASGNSASDTQQITITDTTPPTIDQHADITVLTNNPAGVAVSYDAPATHDLVDGDGTATCTPLSGAVFTPGHTTVTCSATDSRGNSAIDSFFDVFVDLDAIPPEAYNQFDPATKNILVFSTDDHPGMPMNPISPTSVTQAKWNAEDDDDREDHRTNAELRTYEITDAAGNKMTLKEIVKIKGKEIKVKVLSIQYGDGTPIKPDKNKKAFEWSINKDGTIKELEQKMTTKEGKSKQEVKAKYSSKKDQTKIESEKPKVNLTKQGLALLQMHTANGKLVIKY